MLFPLLFLTGCAELSVQDDKSKETDSQVIAARHASLNAIKGWLIKGRIAIQSQQEGWTASLHWVQDSEIYNLRVIAPLGQGTFELRGNDKQVFLLTSKNQLFTATNPEELLLNNVGWNVPLHGLVYWVRGIPEPGTEIINILRDEQGRITDMQQSGWRISYLRYTDGKVPELPEKIFMQNDQFKLRLVIQDWKVAS